MFEEGLKLKAKYGADQVADLSLGNPVVEPPPAVPPVCANSRTARTPGRIATCPTRVSPRPGRPSPSTSRRETGEPYGEQHIVMTAGAGGAPRRAPQVDPRSRGRGDRPGPVLRRVRPLRGELRGARRSWSRRTTPSPRTRMRSPRRSRPAPAPIITNAPNNPTGVVYDAAALGAVGQVLEAASEKHGRPIYWISDEPYRALAYDGVEVPWPIHHYAHLAARHLVLQGPGPAGRAHRLRRAAAAGRGDGRALRRDRLLDARARLRERAGAPAASRGRAPGRARGREDLRPAPPPDPRGARRSRLRRRPSRRRVLRVPSRTGHPRTTSRSFGGASRSGCSSCRARASVVPATSGSRMRSRSERRSRGRRADPRSRYDALRVRRATPPGSEPLPGDDGAPSAHRPCTVRQTLGFPRPLPWSRVSRAIEPAVPSAPVGRGSGDRGDLAGEAALVMRGGVGVEDPLLRSLVEVLEGLGQRGIGLGPSPASTACMTFFSHVRMADRRVLFWSGAGLGLAKPLLGGRGVRHRAISVFQLGPRVRALRAFGSGKLGERGIVPPPEGLKRVSTALGGTWAPGAVAPGARRGLRAARSGLEAGREGPRGFVPSPGPEGFPAPRLAGWPPPRGVPELLVSLSRRCETSR